MANCEFNLTWIFRKKIERERRMGRYRECEEKKKNCWEEKRIYIQKMGERDWYRTVLIPFKSDIYVFCLKLRYLWIKYWAIFVRLTSATSTRNRLDNCIPLHSHSPSFQQQTNELLLISRSKLEQRMSSKHLMWCKKF